MFVFQSFPLTPCMACTVIALGTLRGLMCRDTLSSTPFQCLGWRRLVETCDTRKAPCRRHDFTFTPGHLECHGCQTSNWNNNRKKMGPFSLRPSQTTLHRLRRLWSVSKIHSLTHPAIFHYALYSWLPACRLIQLKMSISTAMGIFTEITAKNTSLVAVRLISTSWQTVAFLTKNKIHNL